MTTRTFVFLAGMGVAFAGCTPTQILGGQAYIKDVQGGTKSVQSILRKSEAKPGYYDHVVRICDVDPQGKDANCQDTVIVETVQ